MKKTILALATSLTLLSIPASAEIVEAIVARVGDRIITRSQYSERLRAAYVEIDRTATRRLPA